MMSQSLARTKTRSVPGWTEEVVFGQDVGGLKLAAEQHGPELPPIHGPPRRLLTVEAPNLAPAELLSEPAKLLTW